MFPIYICKICLTLSQWGCIHWILLETLRYWITLKAGLESAPLLVLGIYSIFLSITFPSWKIITLLFHGMVAEDDLCKAFNLLKWKWSHSVIDSLWPHGLSWYSPGNNTGVGSCSLLQGILPTQGLNPGLPQCRWILYQLIHQGSPSILEWVAYPFSRGSSQPRNQTGVSRIAGGFFAN